MEIDVQALTKTFSRNGYVHMKGFFSSPEVEEFEANLARFIRDVAPTLLKSEAMYQDYSNPETLKMITCLERDPFFLALFTGQTMKGLAEALLEDKAIPIAMHLFNKPAHIGAATPPHQDGYYYCLVPNEALTVWIPLDDVSAENGALHYWKGSHKKGLLPHGASNVLGFSQGAKDGIGGGVGSETVLEVKRGDCLIHHSLMLHSAGPNTSERMRRALGLTYYAERAKVDEHAIQRYKESVAEQQKQAIPS
jgi:phytanoyl-CoA hydroxylase